MHEKALSYFSSAPSESFKAKKKTNKHTKKTITTLISINDARYQIQVDLLIVDFSQWPLIVIMFGSKRGWLLMPERVGGQGSTHTHFTSLSHCDLSPNIHFRFSSIYGGYQQTLVRAADFHIMAILQLSVVFSQDYIGSR